MLSVLSFIVLLTMFPFKASRVTFDVSRQIGCGKRHSRGTRNARASFVMQSLVYMYVAYVASPLEVNSMSVVVG